MSEVSSPEQAVEHQDCLFCRIVAKDIPADVVRETDQTVAFRDIAPQAPTHVLVVPRRHFSDAATLVAADPELAGTLLAAAAAVADSERLADSGGYRLVFNTGRAAGQTVFHAHVHVLGGRQLGALG
jgi:histidine triad (HIT) family protein